MANCIDCYRLFDREVIDRADGHRCPTCFRAHRLARLLGLMRLAGSVPRRDCPAEAPAVATPAEAFYYAADDCDSSDGDSDLGD